jgi:GNAT superfamily N-acetyltransferase
MDTERFFGYVYSTIDDDGTPVLRQIFVDESRRRSGVGTALIQYWAEKYAFPKVEKFGIESPNYKSLGILEKLGYVRRDGDIAIGLRCSIFSEG